MLDRRTASSDKLMQAFFDLCHEGIVLVDAEGKIFSANNVLTTLTDYTAYELRNLYFVQLLQNTGGETSQASSSDPLRLIELSTREPVQSTLLTKNEGMLPVEFSAQKIDNDTEGWNYLLVVNVISKATTLQKRLGEMEEELGRMRSVVEDHSIEGTEWELEELERRLREVENYLENLMDASGECIIVTSLNGDIIRMNAALVDLLGYPIEGLMGKRLLDITPVIPGEYISTTGERVVIDEEFLARDEKVQAQIGQEGKKQYETYLLQKDGKIVPMEMSTIILYDEMDKKSGTVSVARDATERKKVLESLKKAKEQAEDAIRLKSEFLPQEI